MSTFLSFVSPWEFLLRYTVVIGMVIAIIGVAMCLMAKRITMAKRNTDVVDKRDKLYSGIIFIGVSLILLAMIIIALPIEATLYVGG